MLATLKKKFGNMKAVLPGTKTDGKQVPAAISNETQQRQNLTTASTTVYKHMEDQRRFEKENGPPSGRRDGGQSVPPPGSLPFTHIMSDKRDGFMA